MKSISYFRQSFFKCVEYKFSNPYLSISLVFCILRSWSFIVWRTNFLSCSSRSRASWLVSPVTGSRGSISSLDVFSSFTLSSSFSFFNLQTITQYTYLIHTLYTGISTNKITESQISIENPSSRTVRHY